MTGRTMLALLFVCLLCGRAQAHGPEQWIADENLHDPASGLFCCGPNDCKPLKRGDVSETMGGWLVKEQGDPVAEFIPYSRGIPKIARRSLPSLHRCRVHSRLAVTNG